MSKNLYQRNGVWYGRMQVDGRDVRRSLMTPDPIEAAKRLDEMKREALAAKPASDAIRREFIAELRRRRRACGRSVYFVQAENGGAIKIGYSVNPEARLARMQGTALGAKLRLIAKIDGGPEIEQLLHERFAKDRLNGEWFRPSMRLRRFIAALNPPADRISV